MPEPINLHARSVQGVSDAYLCSACGGCKAVCSRQAITFQDSAIGRRYAVVGDTCTGCGLCRQVCPSLSAVTAQPSGVTDRYVGTLRGVYVGRATDGAIYANAQSGGVCTALLVHLFESGAIDGAVVVRMDAGKVPQVRGVLVSSPQELAATQKSCYTPVDLLSVLQECQARRSLAVVGLPCHLEAVENLQRVAPRRFANIAYRIGLICDRTLSGGIQDVICRLAEPMMGGGIYPLERQIRWRDKSAGPKKKSTDRYKNAPLVVCNARGEQAVLSRQIRFALKDMFTPPRCRVCYDKMNLFSDITLGDPWGMSGVDWDKGDSLILTRTERGSALLAAAVEAGRVRMQAADQGEMLRGQVVERRREQVRRYVLAYRKMPFAMADAAILGAEREPEGNCPKEEKELGTFVRRDAMDKEALFAIANEIIRAHERRQSLAWRILRKLKHILTRQ